MTFSKQLNCLLKARGMTAAELSRRTRVPKQTISDWLGGTHPRNMNHVKKVADTLDVTILELFFGESSDRPKNEVFLGSVEAYAKQATERTLLLQIFSNYREELKDKRPKSDSSEFLNSSHQRPLIQESASFFFLYSPALLQILNLNNGYSLELSPSWVHLLGWSIKELKSKRWIEWIHPNDRRSTIKAIEALIISNDLTTTCFHRLLKKDEHYQLTETVISIDHSNQTIMTISTPIKE
jgi:transcriptional regulator with XRE-family HTH domain